MAEAKEAELVTYIMERYLELGSVQDLADHLNAQGYKTKVQIRASGPHRGGCDFRRGTLYHLLANPIYRGQIVHKGEVYPGEHPAIVPQDLWLKVQDKLKAKASGTARRIKGQQPSLLAGLLEDSHNRAMTPSHASKGKGKRYRYYVTRPDHTCDQPAYRVSAHDLETIVTDTLARYFASASNVADLAPADITAHDLQQALAKADLTAASLRSGTAKAKHTIITQVLARATLHEDKVELDLSAQGISNVLGVTGSTSPPITLSVPATRQRRGHQIRLVIEGTAPPPKPIPTPQRQRDDRFLAQLADAFAARKLVLDNPHLTLAELAKREGRCRKHLAKLVEMSCVGPDIVEAILAGNQPSSLTAARLRAGPLHLS